MDYAENRKGAGIPINGGTIPERPLGTVEIVPGYEVPVTYRWPCAFHRWVTRVLLGWKWTRS